MGESKRGRLGRWWHAPVWSPTGFLVRAVLVSVVFVALHAAGLRAYTDFVSGTVRTIGGNRYAALAAGVTYMIFTFAFYVLAPVLGIGAGVLAALERALARRGSNSSEEEACAD